MSWKKRLKELVAIVLIVIAIVGFTPLAAFTLGLVSTIVLIAVGLFLLGYPGLFNRLQEMWEDRF